ncbi:MAG: phosphoribosylformylglycinamidine cyclo-ligase [Proteobacteria bacterium]|nr:MAG: phosphoribosylformylglycinamidine cyclo-ligase [Pseudomonadota bacterium]
MDYKSAGVNVDEADRFVDRLKGLLKTTHNSRVIDGVGGFAALYELSKDRWLASGTDGVGTKLKIAQKLGIHDTIGIDCVAMCVNDVICTGARPLFFLDYLAIGRLDRDITDPLLDGFIRGCLDAETALIGGETAEMPGIYAPGVYDLAGFAVGELSPEQWISGKDACEGDVLIGLPSSGFHSNGYSLIRKLIRDNEESLERELLTPTRIYVKPIQKLLQDQRSNVTGLAHITGSGYLNIPRINESLGYAIKTPLPQVQLPSSMRTILERAKLTQDQAYETFNMGVGMVIAVRDSERAIESLKKSGESPWILGRITDEFSGVRIG